MDKIPYPCLIDCFEINMYFHICILLQKATMPPPGIDISLTYVSKISRNYSNKFHSARPVPFEDLDETVNTININFQ